MLPRYCLPALAVLLLSACQKGEDSPYVTAQDAVKFDAIAEGDTLYFSGNEPFWGGRAVGDQLTYTTPENPDGTTITVRRFAGLNGLGLSGTLDGQLFDMAVTPAKCADTMADRTYPFAITISIGNEIREGCGWSDRKPFEETAAP